jgi:hypothetical protein
MIIRLSNFFEVPVIREFGLNQIIILPEDFFRFTNHRIRTHLAATFAGKSSGGLRVIKG